MTDTEIKFYRRRFANEFVRLKGLYIITKLCGFGVGGGLRGVHHESYSQSPIAKSCMSPWAGGPVEKCFFLLSQTCFKSWYLYLMVIQSKSRTREENRSSLKIISNFQLISIYIMPSNFFFTLLVRPYFWVTI